MTETILSMKGIQKYFPGVHALDNVSFDLRAGEVHALVGENGAGKSTLMKILTGIYQKDAGTIELYGKQTEIISPKEAQQAGISIIHQELNLMRDLSVAENIYIGREPMRGILLDKKEQSRMAQELLSSHNIDILPHVLVKTLSVAKQQMVEIAKALSYRNTRILVMDEPSAALTTAEIEDLFRFIRELKTTGVGIIYISHRMDELKQISDRITVMRDGQYVGTANTSEISLDEIINMMVGRVIYEEPKSYSNVPPDAPVVMEVKNLKSLDVDDVSFNLKKGEILGFAGLMGAGRTEAMRLIFGADKRDAGEVRINGKLVDIRNPIDAVSAGIGYLSEDRKQFGLCLGLSVSDNVALPCLDTLSGKITVDDEKLRNVAGNYVNKINIKTPTVDALMRTLSGGNQQKVVIAKWLLRNCDILIFDEPTRGIDVGAKSEIYKLMNQLAADGKSIIMISSELPELLRMSDRIVVMCEGKKTSELDIAEATQEKIMTYATYRG
ncbi:MAG: sugar ABC transporter ATP-binding protein [Clostridia bacterium]